MCENIIYRQEMIYLFSFKVCIQCVYLLYLPNYLATYLPSYLPFLPTYVSIFLSTYLPILSYFLPTYSIFLSTYLPILSNFLPTYLSSYLIFYTYPPLNHIPMHLPFFISCSTRSFPLTFIHSYNRPTTFSPLSKLI